jgi:hypothetical protein
MSSQGRSSSTREYIGLRKHSASTANANGDDRTTLTTPAGLFNRANSTASIDTNADLGKYPTDIWVPTAPRRGSLTNQDNSNTAKLIYHTSYGGRMEFALVKDETIMGRKEGNDIVLSDVKISKRHASIQKRGQRYVVFHSATI